MKSVIAIGVGIWLAPTLACAEGAASTTAPPRRYEIGRPHHCEEYFPKDLQRQGAEGDTLLSFVVTAQGSVRDISIAKSSGNKGLDWAATVCASHWNYKPATRDGMRVDLPWKAQIVWTVPAETPSDNLTPQSQAPMPPKP